MNISGNNQNQEYTGLTGYLNIMGNQNTIRLSDCNLTMNTNGNYNNIILVSSRAKFSFNGNYNHLIATDGCSVTFGINGNYNILEADYSSSMQCLQCNGTNNNYPINGGQGLGKGKSEGRKNNKKSQNIQMGSNQSSEQIAYNGSNTVNSGPWPQMPRVNSVNQNRNASFGNNSNPWNYNVPRQMGSGQSFSYSWGTGQSGNHCWGQPVQNPWGQQPVQMAQQISWQSNPYSSEQQVENFMGFPAIDIATGQMIRPAYTNSRQRRFQFRNQENEVEALDDDDQLMPNGQGLTLEELKMLPVSKNKGKVTNCSICLTDIKTDQNETYLFCFHPYHSKCIRDWLSRSVQCPLCKEDVKENIRKLKNGVL